MSKHALNKHLEPLFKAGYRLITSKIAGSGHYEIEIWCPSKILVKTHTSATSSDKRAGKNLLSQIKRLEREKLETTMEISKDAAEKAGQIIDQMAQNPDLIILYYEPSKTYHLNADRTTNKGNMSGIIARHLIEEGYIEEVDVINFNKKIHTLTQKGLATHVARQKNVLPQETVDQDPPQALEGSNLPEKVIEINAAFQARREHAAAILAELNEEEFQIVMGYGLEYLKDEAQKEFQAKQLRLDRIAKVATKLGVS